MRNGPAPANPLAVAHASLASRDALEDALAWINRALQADAAGHKLMYQQAAAAFKANPVDFNKLRLGAVLSVPGHEHSDVARARHLLGELQSVSNRISAPMAHVLRIRLNTMNRNQLLQERVDALAAENVRLRTELDEAAAKLRALSSIEQQLDQPPRKR